MNDNEIIAKLEPEIKNSDNWSVYHHLKDNLGHPALMLRDTNAANQGVNLDVFNGAVYLFLDNGTPAEPGKPFSVQTQTDLMALTELLGIIKPYIKEN